MGIDVNGLYQVEPDERPTLYLKSILTVGIVTQPDGIADVCIRGLSGPAKYDAWLTPENARLTAQLLLDTADVVEAGPPYPDLPPKTDERLR